MKDTAEAFSIQHKDEVLAEKRCHDWLVDYLCPIYSEKDNEEREYFFVADSSTLLSFVFYVKPSTPEKLLKAITKEFKAYLRHCKLRDMAKVLDENEPLVCTKNMPRSLMLAMNKLSKSARKAAGEHHGNFDTQKERFAFNDTLNKLDCKCGAINDGKPFVPLELFSGNKTVAASPAKASEPVFKLYAELADFKPKMWRRFYVPMDYTMEQLAFILMAMFNMSGSHLYSFMVPNQDMDIGCELDSMGFGDPSTHAASEVTLKDVFDGGDSRFTFVYDFGDDWEVKVKLEKFGTIAPVANKDLPYIDSGAGFGIIEDCGGVYGLEDIAEAFKSKTGEQYEEYREWLGMDESEDLDLTTFDRDKVNDTIKSNIISLKGASKNFSF